jgi:tight adherence protein B
MAIDPQYLILGAVFIVVLLLVEGLAYLASDLSGGSQRRVNRRLRMLQSGQDTQTVLQRLRRKSPGASLDALQRTSVMLGPLAWLDRLITHAGLSIPTSQMLVVMGGLFGVGFISGLLLVGPSSAIAVALGSGIAVPVIFLQFRKWRRLKKFGYQLPEGIDVIVRSLRAGHPISTAMGMVASEMSDPIGTEFGIAVDEMTYGLDLREALDNMLTRVGHPDLQFMVAAVNVQHAIGGNLAEILANLSKVIRDRFRMLLKIKALSAEGRISAVILSIMPFAVYGFISLTRPDYYGKVKDDPLYLTLIGTGATLAFIGVGIMYKMVRFRV